MGLTNNKTRAFNRDLFSRQHLLMSFIDIIVTNSRISQNINRNSATSELSSLALLFSNM